MKSNLSPAASPIGQKKTAKNFFMQYAIYLVLFCIIIVIVALDPSFLSMRNITNILQQAATKLVIALGAAGILVLGGTDLSAGKAVGMAGIICASLLQDPSYSLRIYSNMPQLSLIVPFLIAAACCVIFGVAHSYLVSTLRIAPFIASLGMQMVIYGSMSLYFEGVNNSSPIGGLDPRYTSVAQGSFYLGSLRVPYIVLYAIVIAVLFWVLWNRTRLGRNMFAVGGNSEAAEVSGVSVTKTIMGVFLYAGLMYGIASFLEGARIQSVGTATGINYELDAIAGCVIGGVSFNGGIGTVPGVVIGSIILQAINYGLYFLGVNAYLQYIIRGAIIIIAVAIDVQKYVAKK